MCKCSKKKAPKTPHRSWVHTMDPSGRYLINADGARLNRFEWACATATPRALVFLSHGSACYLSCRLRVRGPSAHSFIVAVVARGAARLYLFIFIY